MLRAVTALASTIAGLVLLLSFKTHAPATLAMPPAAVSSATAGSTTTSAATTSRAGTRTIAGSVESTPYGPIQVQVTVRSGVVTAVAALRYPSGDGRSAQINAYAIPLLNAEATKAKSAGISHVSGATYTSDGYIASLQSALAKA